MHAGGIKPAFANAMHQLFRLHQVMQ